MRWVVHGEVVGRWVSQQLGLEPLGGCQGLGLVGDGEILAGVCFDGWNQASICMHIAAVPGARWMTRNYLQACFRYPFIQLKVNKILGLVGARNREARRFDEHLGFVLEATLKDAHPDGDLMVYSMTKEQCRWLNVAERKSHNGQELCTAPD